MKVHRVTWKELMYMMKTRNIKVPQKREAKKVKHDPLLSSRKDPQIDFTTVSYLEKIGVPTDGLTDPVKIKRLSLREFIIVKDG